MDIATVVIYGSLFNTVISFLAGAVFIKLFTPKDYIYGYLKGFVDCAKKDLTFLESLPPQLKDQYNVKVSYDDSKRTIKKIN